MSTIGYNGRVMTVKLDDAVIAAITSSTFTRNKEAVDVTNNDSNGWRIVLPEPGTRSIDCAIEGVCTENNYAILRAAWNSSTLLDVTLVDADLNEITAANGFFFANLENTGGSADAVTFTAQLQSSGIVTEAIPTPP